MADLPNTMPELAILHITLTAFVTFLEGQIPRDFVAGDWNRLERTRIIARRKKVEDKMLALGANTADSSVKDDDDSHGGDDGPDNDGDEGGPGVVVGGTAVYDVKRSSSSS